MTAPAFTDVAVKLHKKLAFLAQPAPGKVLYGGRDGIKSWGMAQQLILDGATRPERILCARETQNSIADSVHKLLKDRIFAMGLDGFYEVQQSTILSKPFPDGNRTEFLFHGIKHNVQKIKSMERITKVWLEEAENISDESLDVILPTIRTEGAEVWISFNPKMASDPIYRRAVLNPPPGWVVAQTSYQDNIWLSSTSRANIEHMRATDPRAFRHIYGGEPLNEVEGAIFEQELSIALESGRIGEFHYDRTKPVDIVYDLGFGDPTAMWFVQPLDGYLNFIDYYENNNNDITHYVIEAQKRGYMVRTHWLPHDATNNLTHRRLAGAADLSLSIPTIMQQAGCKVMLTPALPKTDVLNAARARFPQCRFNKATCQLGIDRLRLYQWDRKPDETGKRKPLHDASSHGADAFMGACLSVKPGMPAEPDDTRSNYQRPAGGPQGWMETL